MANLQLKKTILEVVNNQINANEPPCTKDVYDGLQEVGYSNQKQRIKSVQLY